MVVVGGLLNCLPVQVVGGRFFSGTPEIIMIINV